MGKDYVFQMVPDPDGPGESWEVGPDGEWVKVEGGGMRLEMTSEGVTHVDEETARIWYDRMEWHVEQPQATLFGVSPHWSESGFDCTGRHGVLRNVPDELLDAAKEGIGYFMGHGGDHAKPNGDGTWDVEFVHMSKVFPPPDAPWEWCGKSVLWPERSR